MYTLKKVQKEETSRYTRLISLISAINKAREKHIFLDETPAFSTTLYTIITTQRLGILDYSEVSEPRLRHVYFLFLRITHPLLKPVIYATCFERCNRSECE